MSDTALILKHYCLLSKNIESLSDGQARLKQTDGDTDGIDNNSLLTVFVTIMPRTGPYRGGKFDFELDLSAGYPTSPPVVRAHTTMYHPNVDCLCFYDEDETGGDVCLNLLDELWSPDMTLEDVVQGLLFLLQEPNLDDPLSSIFDGTEDKDEYLRNVRRSLHGGLTVDDVHFKRNLVDGYESDNEEENEVAPSDQDNVVSNSEGTQVETQSIPTLQNSDNDDSKTREMSLPHTIPYHDDTLTTPSPLSLPTPTTHTAPDPPMLDSPVDREHSPPLFSQQHISLNAFDKMWTLSLNSIIRTIILGGALRTNEANKMDTSDVVDIR